MEQTLWASVQRLAPLGPRFVAVTYGAHGEALLATRPARARVSTVEELHRWLTTHA